MSKGRRFNPPRRTSPATNKMPVKLEAFLLLDAYKCEKYLKTGVGRKFIKDILNKNE